MSRFYIKPDCVKADRIYAGENEARHIAAVMRLQAGDEIAAFDGTGKEYTGTIEEVSRKRVVIKIEKVKLPGTPKKTYTLTLAQAVPKMDKMDYIIQKAAELGVDSIIPMNTKRVIVKFTKERAGSRRKRWQRIAQEAAKQCGRSSLAAIKEYTDFQDLLKDASQYSLVILPTVLPFKKESLKKKLSSFTGGSILMIIGPEGGFDPAELEAASKENVLFISLGENTLRCDTAAISLTAMINYALSEI